IRRLSSEQAELAKNVLFMDSGYKVEPYTTVKGNFSWKLTEPDEE
ncbi:hypothetical protein MOB81_15315, partial [Bacillus atrophaeus]